MRDYKNDRKPSRRLKALIRRSKARGLKCELSLDEYVELISKKCYYCDGELPEIRAGLDRIDASKGYISGNVLPCCENCNKLKGNLLTVEETYVIVQGLKELRQTDNVWMHHKTTAQTRKRRKKNGI